MKTILFAITCLLFFSSFNSKPPVKYIYLTFDDGPLKGSDQLIDNLRKHENYVFEHVRFYPRK